MLNHKELTLYLLKHPSLKGPIKASLANNIMGIEWADPVILPEEIKKLSEDIGIEVISFGYLFDKLHIFFPFEQ